MFSHRTHRTHRNVLCENPSRRKPSVISVLSVGDKNLLSVGG